MKSGKILFDFSDYICVREALPNAFIKLLSELECVTNTSEKSIRIQVEGCDAMILKVYDAFLFLISWTKIIFGESFSARVSLCERVGG
jgi:hypothetical protein